MNIPLYDNNISKSWKLHLTVTYITMLFLQMLNWNKYYENVNIDAIQINITQQAKHPIS